MKLARLTLSAKEIYKMDETNSLKNLFTNLSFKQKIGILAAIILIIVLIIMVVALVPKDSLEDKGDSTSQESSLEPQSSSATIEKGTKWENTDAGSETTEEADIPTSTEYNENHTYTLEEYLPASRYEYKNKGDDTYGIRDYWWIMENTAVEKGIVVSVDSCDEEGNTAAAKEYLKSIPIDLSSYYVVYQTHIGEVPCTVN